MKNIPSAAPFAAARFIKEIGRGKNGARSLSRNDALDNLDSEQVEQCLRVCQTLHMQYNSADSGNKQ
jgi:hypothetical protein